MKPYEFYEVGNMKYLMGVLALLTLLACGKDTLPQEIFEKVDKVVYRFKDSSVPPKYHRSYTITATESLARIVVDSYGDILKRKTTSMAPSRFRDILDVIRESHVTTCKMKARSGCSGGTSENLKLMRDENELFKGSVYHCGGKDYGDLCGNIDAVAEELKSLFPDFDRLIK